MGGGSDPCRAQGEIDNAHNDNRKHFKISFCFYLTVPMGNWTGFLIIQSSHIPTILSPFIYKIGGKQKGFHKFNFIFICKNKILMKSTP